MHSYSRIVSYSPRYQALLADTHTRTTAPRNSVCRRFVRPSLVLPQGSMDRPKGENMDAGNLYGVMTIMATLMIAPFALLVEGSKFRGLWAAAMAAGHTKCSIVKGTVLSSLFFYMYK